MATLLFQAAGAALGSIFGPFGAIVGRAVGALAGSAVDRSLLGGTKTIIGPRLTDARLPGADEGTAISRVYGTARIGGTLIWATRFEEQVLVERAGGKASGPKSESYRYCANIALGLCEGPVVSFRRMWADGREVDLSAVLIRVYTGAHTQPPDPLIEAKQGEGNTPAYRGLSYIVLERFPLDAYGNRIPVIQFEVICPIGALEEKIRAVTVIPGSTEHGYDPNLVTDRPGGGSGRHINRNMIQSSTDWLASLAELQGVCPNLKSVALVVAWFGTDLRAGDCRIVPGVETYSRSHETRPWHVSGISRQDAYLVSENGGAPAYGGTPSDRSVIAAIQDLRARGLKVYLYPFLMMDVPDGNGLPDPYGGAEQAPYPWRGRVTCHPPSADGTSAARDQVRAFLGSVHAGHFTISGDSVVSPAGDEGYRRMVLHYALLAEVAGGVDGFLIGSEMRGLSFLRDDEGRFPFVDGLCDLAGDVRGVLRPDTKITYAADWSEYFGYHPPGGSGEVRFHLDALWAHPAIDAVGIDNYMPLADWQDGDMLAGNPDGFRHAEDVVGMRDMLGRGEGFDWYYASEADRRAQPDADHRRDGRKALGISLQGPRKLVDEPAFRPGPGRRGSVEPDRLGAAFQADLVHRTWLPGHRQGREPAECLRRCQERGERAALPFRRRAQRFDAAAFPRRPSRVVAGQWAGARHGGSRPYFPVDLGRAALSDLSGKPFALGRRGQLAARSLVERPARRGHACRCHRGHPHRSRFR